jgi:hypothetical protein
MTIRRALLMPLSLAAFTLVACQGGSSPTETSLPALDSAKSASTLAVAPNDDGTEARADRPLAAARAAREAAGAESTPGAAAEAAETAGITAAAHGGNGGSHGNHGGGNGGNGGNNGNGGNGGNGGGHGHGGDLSLAMQPDVWNTNYDHSEGTVSALVRGADAGKIDPASVVLSCAGGTADPTRVQKGGGQLRAFFTKQDAIACLGTVKPGDTQEVTLKFNVVAADGTSSAKELTDTVRVVGKPTDDGDDDGEEEETTVAIQPNDWNTNWLHSQGTVSALLRGDDVPDIDLKTVALVGDSGTEVLPVSVKRTGHEVRARFPMSKAFASLDDPDPGETHTVKVKYSVAAAGGTSTAKELSVDVHVVGPAIP